MGSLGLSGFGDSAVHSARPGRNCIADIHINAAQDSKWRVSTSGPSHRSAREDQANLTSPAPPTLEQSRELAKARPGEGFGRFSEEGWVTSGRKARIDGTKVG